MKMFMNLAATLAALSLCASPAIAQDKKISALPAAAALTGPEKLSAVQGAGCATSVAPCTNVAVTPAQIATYANTALGLGTASTKNTGTSGGNVPLLNTANTWSAAQTFGSLKAGSALTIPLGGLSNPNLTVSGSNGSGSAIGASRWSADASGPTIGLGKSRSATIGTYSAILSGDTLGVHQFFGDDGTAMVQGAGIQALAAENFTLTARGSYLDFQTAALGSTTVTTRMRLTDTMMRPLTSGGLSLGDASFPFLNIFGITVTPTNIGNAYFTAVTATPGFRATQAAAIDIGTPASSAALGGIYVDASGLGTAVQDDIASSISFGRKGAGRRGAMIAGLHTSSDVNQMGLGVYLKSSTTSASSAVTLRWKWDHTGNFLPAIDNNVTVGSASLRMLGGYFAKLNISGLTTYSDNAAAIAGGLAEGDVYRTAAGVLMVRY